MVTGIIGRKVGMTQIFDADGTVHPATVIKAGPCVVVQAKTKQTDGYEAVQLGLVEETPAKAGKPMAPPRSRRSATRRCNSAWLRKHRQKLASRWPGITRKPMCRQRGCGVKSSSPPAATLRKSER